MIDIQVNIDWMFSAFKIAVLKGIFHKSDQNKGNDSGPIHHSLYIKVYIKIIVETKLIYFDNITYMLNFILQRRFAVFCISLAQCIAHNIGQGKNPFR